jgi:hypothetical protein
MTIVESVHGLPALMAGMLPHATDIAQAHSDELLEFLALIGTANAALQASSALAAAEIDRRSARELGAESLAKKAGVKSGAELVQKITGSTRAEALKAVRVGSMLEAAQEAAPELPDRPVEPGPRSIDVLAGLGGSWDAPVAVAVRNGWLSADQGDRLKTGLGSPRDTASHDAWRHACLRLIGDCWEGELTAEDVKRLASQLRACLDQQWALQNAGRLREQRSLKRIVRGDGMVKYELLLDPLTDAEVWTPIYRHLSPRLGGRRFMTDGECARAVELELDSRTNEQLLADTFTGFLSAGVTASGVFGKNPPTVSIAVTTTELAKALRNPGHGIGWLDGTEAAVTGGEILTSLCTGDHLATLFDPTGQALDVTKKERTFSARQRKAMALRDGGCLWPGCSMPPGATEAHHCNPWAENEDNRRSETRDGVLLCKFHHLNLHNQRGRIERRGSQYWLHWPGSTPIRLIPKHGVIAQLTHEGAIA